MKHRTWGERKAERKRLYWQKYRDNQMNTAESAQEPPCQPSYANKITLTILKNPFNTADREIHHLEYVPEKTVSEYVQLYDIGVDDFIYGCNGKKVEAGHVPNDGDFIAVCPVVGKNILASILSLGLMIFTGGLYGPAGTTGFLGATSGTFMARLITTAVMMVGGAIINAICPPPKAESSTTSPSYGWSGISPIEAQGGSLARTYGTMKTAGTMLVKHVTTDGDKQYLSLLATGGQGPAASITNICINGNPIANYKDAIVETRLGLNDQPVITNFGDTFADQSLNYELQYPHSGISLWSTQRTSGNAGQGLEITVEIPGGLFYSNSKGGLDSTSVSIAAQFMKVGDSVWTDWPLIDDDTKDPNNILTVIRGLLYEDLSAVTPTLYNGKITGAKNTAVRRVYRIDNIPSGQYDVRVKCTNKSGVKEDDSINVRYSNRIFWTQLSQIIYDDFCRPNKILVGVKALATDQLNGSDITLTWDQSVEVVNVWNPTLSQYQEKPARNNAWASYDILHGCRKLKNIHTGLYEYVVDNAPVSQMDYQGFSDWADHCTTLGLQFEHLFTEATDVWTALKVPETFGRGKVIPKGTKFSAICDKPSIPVQMFTVGNIDQGSFSKDYMGLTDRANSVEISFINAAKGYQKDAITVYSADWNTSTVVKNPTQITLDGCTSYEQAYAFGKYLLRVNALLQRTCTWDADIDAIACQMGDQVLLQHDVPEWGAGGRLVAATATTLTLDRTVTMEAGKTYSVIVRLGDDSLVTKAVTTVPGDTSTLTVTTAFDPVPQLYDLYAFGEIHKEAKPFIVVDVDRIDDLTCTLTGVEYVAAVYEESIDAPEISYTAPEVSISNLQINQRTIWNGVSSETYLDVAWSPARENYFGAQVNIQFNGGIESKAATTGHDVTTASIKVTLEGTYTVNVYALDQFGGPTGNCLTKNITVGSQTNTPEPATNTLTVAFTDVCLWTWGGSPDIGVDYYELRLDQNPGVDAGLLARTPATRTIATPPTRNGTAYLYAHNVSGFYSTPVSLAYNKPAPAAPAVTITDTVRGFVVGVPAVPPDCVGINAYIDAAHSPPTACYFSPNNAYAFNGETGIFAVQVAYVDVFGEGAKSTQINKTVNPTVDASWLHITQDTVFDNDVIVAGMIAAGAVTGEKIAAEVELTSPLIDGGVITGGTVISGRFQNATNTAYIDGDGNIHGVNITGSTIDSDSITSAGFTVHASAMVKGTIAHGSTIPLPSGYTDGQCVWGIFGPVPNSVYAPGYGPPDYYTPSVYGVNPSRVVTASFYWSYSSGDIEYSGTDYGSVYYWIMGVK